jgi:rare lipoprotein A
MVPPVARRAAGRGGIPPDQTQGVMMAAAARPLAHAGMKTTIMSAIFAAVFFIGAGQHASAQAPIVYASPTPSVRLTNSVESLPSSLASPSYASEAKPIDLRPGSSSANLRPAPMPAPYSAPARSFTPVPAPAAPMAFAEPYAGPPYQVDGKWYVPTYEPNYDEVGVASWYGPTFHGKDSASGEEFDENAMTAAHPTLPIPSLVKVTNLENGRSVVVRLNDRGPFVDDRIIDLSKKAGEALDLHGKGTAKVRVQYVGPAPAAPNSVPAQSLATSPLPPAPMPAPAARQEFRVSTQPLPPVAPVQARPAMNQHGYFLQAGSFADLGNAEALRARLFGLGPVSLATANVGGTDYYRVMVGPWASRAKAEQAQSRLSESGQKTIVVSR